MSNTPADTQGRPHPDRRSDTPEVSSEHNPGGLMPDIRGEAIEQGRDPEEVDPLVQDEDVLRRMSSNTGVLKP
jgi:hypothetical protein